MPEPTPSPGEQFASRAIARFQDPATDGGPVARIDPATIALILAVLKLVLVWIQHRSSGPANQAASELRAPRWWQPIRLARRLRLLDEIRREVIRRGHEAGPETCLDAVLDEMTNSSAADLEAASKEVRP